MIECNQCTDMIEVESVKEFDDFIVCGKCYSVLQNMDVELFHEYIMGDFRE